MKRLLFFIFYFLVSAISAQVLERSLPFSGSTPYIEPDGRGLTLKLEGDNFVLLSKVKGHLHGESNYQLEKYTKDLESSFVVELACPSHEEYKDLFYNGTEVILFSVLYDYSEKKSTFLAYVFDANTGEKKETKVLGELEVKDWLEVPMKGVVKSTFGNMIGFRLSKHSALNFEYEYQVKYSPDKSKIIVYKYDYSQKHLVAATKIFDKHLALIKEDNIPIDNSFINHGIFVNNKGNLFILNTERAGRIVVIYYDVYTKANKLLDLQNASTNRVSLSLQVFSDKEVYVGCLSIAGGGKLQGVMYSKFDFNKNLIDKINFHDLSIGLQQTIDIMRSSSKHLVGKESYQNFELVHFIVNEYEKIIFVLEKREIVGLDFNYDNLLVNHPNHLAEKVVKVNTEGVVLLSFNKNDELLWENFYQKSQVCDITLGITSSSYSLNITDDGKIFMVFPFSESTSGVFNTVQFVEWDELTGNKVKDMVVPNDDKTSIITLYTVWYEDRVIMVGRKGLLGKKSILYLYKLGI